ncbi:6299_t:CDS:1 [Funneliformis mosseae]|uniref:6299_t:CDS:1 n=1 Tax=Funneliformis mosseae TaxID=27381 RepID=A0A9N9AAE1_FUNMO|nr:6299_t:CDS:1 [Funneliformis mosseae]
MNQIVNQIKSKFILNNQTEEVNLIQSNFIQSNEKNKGEKVNDKQNDFGFNCKCEGDWCECDTNQFFKESKAIGCYKKLNELSKDEKERFKLYGICSDCKQMNTGYSWCNKCDPGRFLREGKRTGNAEIDNLIYESQLKTEHYWDNLEWIPFDNLIDGKLIGEGGFARVHTATWLDGKTRGTIKKKHSPITVALKKVTNPKNVMKAFINEVKL